MSTFGKIMYVKELVDTSRTASLRPASLASLKNSNIFSLRKGSAYKFYVKLQEAVCDFIDVKLHDFLAENGVALIYVKTMSHLELELTVIAGVNIEVDTDFNSVIVVSESKKEISDEVINSAINSELYGPILKKVKADDIKHWVAENKIEIDQFNAEMLKTDTIAETAELRIVPTKELRDDLINKRYNPKSKKEHVNEIIPTENT